MSNPNPSNILFSTRYKYYLNYASQSGSVVVPVTSYAVGTAKPYSITIPNLERTNDFSNIKVNFSTEPNNWYNFPTADLPIGSDFTISTTGGYSGTSLVLTFYVVNQGFGTANNPALTITAQVALFVSP